MREGDPNYTIHSPNHNAIVPETVGSSELFASRAMALDGGIRLGRDPKPRPSGINTRTTLLALLAAVPLAMAQSCIPLTGSTQCPAFQSASISVDSTLVGFLYVFRSGTRDQQLMVTKLARSSDLSRTEKPLTSNCSLTSRLPMCNQSKYI